MTTTDYSPMRRLRRLRLYLWAMLLLPGLFGAVLADDDHLIRIETLVAGKHITEGFVRSNDPVFGLRVYVDKVAYPLYARLSTIRNFDDYQEDEIAAAYAFDFTGNRVLAGVQYSYESKPQNLLSVVDVDGQPSSVQTVQRQLQEESGEAFLEFISEEFYFTQMTFSYRFDLENQGGFFDVGLDANYAITDAIVLGGGVEASFDNGYANIKGLSGFYHVNLMLSFEVSFFEGSGIDFSAVYVLPQRAGKAHGVSEEVVYQASLYFSFL
ncbi:MAG: hypothetical protein K0U66_09030 [Gammaproteobacteria bacterium]|nr:hypothetical protein [Gammaproteobacteria bacterium]